MSAGLAEWSSPRAAIMALVVGGVLIFPATQVLVALEGERVTISKDNALWNLGSQVAMVLPLSMPLLVPVTLYRQDWFYPGMIVLLGAHYPPFTFLYGMRMFVALTCVLVGAEIFIAVYWTPRFAVGAWFTALTLLLFSGLGRILADREYRQQSRVPLRPQG